jgi:hypothetical protein
MIKWIDLFFIVLPPGLIFIFYLKGQLLAMNNF